MIKVLANRCLAFDRGERNASGALIREKTTIGFCSLPDWVGETDYFKAAIKDGSLQMVSQTSSVSDAERIAQLEKQLAEEKLKTEKAAANVKPEDFLPPTKTVEQMTVAELTALAAEKGVTLTSSMKKAEIIEAIKSAE